jgi:uncharacterized membrane protein
MSNNVLKVGKKAKKDLIYKCSKCGNLQAFITGEYASACEICFKKGIKQHWNETNQNILLATKNIKKIIEKRKNFIDKVSDKITEFTGSMAFVYLHIIWFGLWLLYNLTSPEAFDPYPFGLLTLIVSLEAIILATFILISQNRQSEISDMRSELDYETDIRSEKNSAEILALLKKIQANMKK